MQRANKRLASLDVVPWVEHALGRSGLRNRNIREVALTIFGPVLLYIYSLDRGEPAFGLQGDAFLDTWADHWATWFAGGSRPAAGRK